MSTLPAYLPALLLLLFSGWCGTFDGAARGAGAITGHLALIALVVWAGGAARDPLRLGRRGNLLLALAGLALVLSFYTSPVPRAGRVGLVLLLAFLLVPAFVERCWPDSEARRRGLPAIAAVVGGVAAWSLAGWWWLGTDGASLPLGHHNLLAAWLLALLPLAVLPWRDGGAARLLAGGAGLLAVAALLATRSLSGLLALGVVLAAAGWRRRRAWPVLVAALAALAALVTLPAARSRIAAVASGDDVSALARLGYLEAAWRGVVERPLLGWGPGSSSWTLGRFLVPRPGVHPPDEVVADPHSWPLEIAYENGIVGLLLASALAVVFLRARLREEGGDPGLRRAALAGLLGFAVIGLAGRPFAAPALPLAATLMAGALLAAGPPRPRPTGRRPILAAAALALLLAPADLAHLAYDRAVADPERRDALLRRAVRLDPSFPLYRMRLALAVADAGQARAAAEGASGVAHFWLAAGVLGQKSGKPWAEDALVRACDGNPLGALAPFRLALAGGPRAPVRAARALLAEPLLLAADAWPPDRRLAAAAVDELARVDGVALARRAALAAAFERVRDASGPTRRLVLEMDGEGGSALSLHAFRRLPWPAYLDEVSLHAEALPKIGVAAAARLRETDAGVFGERGCGLPGTSR